MRIKSLFILIFTALTTSAASYITPDSMLVVTEATRSIPAFAYQDRLDIKRVVFEDPATFEEIGDYAFLGCRNLENIDLPDGLKSIGEGAFRECASLRKMKIPAGISRLPRHLFSFCESLQEISLSRRLTDIGSACFAYCDSLERVTFPKGLEHIGANAFSFCRKIEEVELPESVTELESYAFSECENLAKAILPANNHLLGELIFSGCRKLEKIICLSSSPPPFDCNSTLFEDNERFVYDKCILEVPAENVMDYKNAPGWKFFKTIRGVSVVNN